MWESAPWPVVDNFRRAFLFGHSPPSTFCVAASRHGHKPTPGSGAASDWVWRPSHLQDFVGRVCVRMHSAHPANPTASETIGSVLRCSPKQIEENRWRAISRTMSRRIVHALAWTKNMRSVIGPKPWVAARMSLPLPWRGWAIQLMRYAVRFTDIGHMGHSERQKYRDGDEDDRASEREPGPPKISPSRNRGLTRPPASNCR